MTRLTLFSAPKPFDEAHISAIQGNALASWSRLKDVDIVLMGAGAGVAQAAREYGALHLPDVRTNASGTPLISSMVELARKHGRGELLGIINADMIVMHDLVDAAQLVKSRLDQYVLLGQRWDLDIPGGLEFSSGWEDRLRAEVQERGELHKPAGSDFFIFPREAYAEIPDFAVGRAGWDNWMVFSARQRGLPVVDCTRSAMVVHQNHDYSHLPGGLPHHNLPESNENIRLAGGTAAIRYTVLDATHCIAKGRLVRPSVSWARVARGIEVLLRGAVFFLPPDSIEAVARPKRWRKHWARFTGGPWRKPTDRNG